ncbi:MAG: AbrB/MazE/SpoVT family DNA-binding domain-containing protein [Rickettsiales bacterium]|nr:AbrB/MazE/SpoVT family DNA-binding domain-containing protein [Rickettsiales bacterium]
MQEKQTPVKIISKGYQITIPNAFRKQNNLDVGSRVSVCNKGDKLIIEPFPSKSPALKALEEVFSNTPEEFKDISEKKMSQIVSKETKSYRKNKNIS